jgi:acyl-CoA thioesterase
VIEDEFAVEPAGDCRGLAGEYAATLTDRWDGLGGPNGGYLLALCLQALAIELPFPDPIAVSAFFLRRGEAGPAWIRTEVVRTGRRIATGQARMIQNGREAVRVTASFADLADPPPNARTLTLSQPPALPPPAECIDPSDGAALAGLSIIDRMQYRFSEVPGWWYGSPGGGARDEFWMRFADGTAASTLTLPMLVDAAAPAIMDLGETTSATVQLTVHGRARPAPGWLACRVMTHHIGGGFHEEDVELWDTTGTLVAQSRQLAVLR